MTFAESNYNPCNVLTALQDFQKEVVEQVYRRILALKRLAEILEAAGDLSTIVGDVLNSLPGLPPVDFLNSIKVYEDLRFACPMLGLPPFNEEAVAELQAKVAAAYAEIVRRLDLHQYNRLDLLQARVDELVAKARSAMGIDWWICAEAICGIAENNFAVLNRNFKIELSRVDQLPADTAENLKKPFRILSDSTQQKVNDLKSARADIVSLGKNSENPEIRALFGVL